MERQLIIRKTLLQDVPRVTEIIDAAREYMRNSGIDQWQDGYPNGDSVRNDVKNGESFVVLKDNEIIATAAISLRGEPTYGYIDGEWKYDERYVVVHRVAVDPNCKGGGVAGEIFSFAAELAKKSGIDCLRIDTHRDNKSMRRCIEKNGFLYSGVIYLEDSSERLAFEKKI